MARIVPFRQNVYIADICRGSLLRGKEKYGFKIVLLEQDCALPFEDNYFDIVHCNSVIEHVTVDKEQVWSLTSDSEFVSVAFQRQKRFAAEIRRVAKKYFVQTPSRTFILEAHTWLPFIQFLERDTLIKMLRWLNKWWVKKAIPDWSYLSEGQMKELFPDSTIVKERFFGLTKSLIAVHNEPLEGRPK